MGETTGRSRMDFKEQVSLGRTGLKVSRIGLASGYGAPQVAIEKAFHEYGINYLYISPLLNVRSMVKAIHDLAPRHRKENLEALEAGPLDEEEMARIRRIGRHIYGKSGKPPLLAR